jgi:hypothetical protein
VKIDISAAGDRVTIYATPAELRDTALAIEAHGSESAYVDDVAIDEQVELTFEHLDGAP